MSRRKKLMVRLCLTVAAVGFAIGPVPSVPPASAVVAQTSSSPNFTLYNASAVAQGLAYRIDFANNSLAAASRGAIGFASVALTDRSTSGTAAVISPGFAVTNGGDVFQLVAGDYAPPVAVGVVKSVVPSLPAFPLLVNGTGNEPVSSSALGASAPDGSYGADGAAQGCTALVEGRMTCAAHATGVALGAAGSVAVINKGIDSIATSDPSALTDPNIMLQGVKNLAGTVTSPVPGVPSPGELLNQLPVLPTLDGAAPIMAELQKAFAAAGLNLTSQISNTGRFVEVQALSAVTDNTAAGSQLIGDATVTLSGVDILGGLVHFDSLVSRSTSTSDGQKSDQRGSVTATGAKVAGLPVVFDQDGVHVADFGAPAAASTLRQLDAQLNQALTAASIQIDVASSDKTETKGQGTVQEFDAFHMLVNPTLPLDNVNIPVVPGLTQPVLEFWAGSVHASSAGMATVATLPGSSTGGPSVLSGTFPSSSSFAPSLLPASGAALGASSPAAKSDVPTVLEELLSGVSRPLTIGFFALWQACGMSLLVNVARRRHLIAGPLSPALS